MQNKATNTIFVIAVVVTAFNVVLQFYPANLAFSQAVDLLPINTGNETLDGSLPVFFECMEEAVDAGENAHYQASYFEDEPTKNEVRKCYQEVLIDNPIEQVTDNPEVKGNED